MVRSVPSFDAVVNLDTFASKHFEAESLLIAWLVGGG